MFSTSQLTSAHSGNRVSVLVCLLLLVINLFSFLPLSSISSTHALEEDEYSVASLWPSLKHLLIWRTEEKINSKVSEPIEPVTKRDQTMIRQSKWWWDNDAKQRPLDKENRICHSCGENSVLVNEKEEYRQRIEFIKEQILTRLGMKRPPKLRPDIDLSLYMRIAENTINQRELSEHGQIRSNEDMEDVDKVFILPLKSELKAPMFDLSTVDTSGNSKVIKSIYILVHFNFTENYYRLIRRVQDDTDLFITSDPSEENDISRSFEIISTVSPMNQSQENLDFDTAHWYQYDVTSLLSEYTGKMIRIHNGNFDILNSVIIIEMTNNKFIRAKRSIDCTDSVSFCCRQHFYVNFTTIGWNNWIFQPAGYNANYCRGKCDLSHARYHHTTVIGKYPAIKLCCSPREMSSISLIYMDDKFNIYQKNLPNMVVESCDCA